MYESLRVANDVSWAGDWPRRVAISPPGSGASGLLADLQAMYPEGEYSGGPVTCKPDTALIKRLHDWKNWLMMVEWVRDGTWAIPPEQWQQEVEVQLMIQYWPEQARFMMGLLQQAINTRQGREVHG